MKIKQKAFLAPLSACLAVSSLLLLPGHGVAQTIGLSDGGSSATVDLSGGGGMNSWDVLGQNQLNQQWFYYSVNGGAVQAINLLGTLTYTTSGLNFLNAQYANSQLSIDVQYVLSGGGVGSGNADITETIAVNNLSGSTANINLYEYSNFNLLQSGHNSVQIFGNSTSGYNFVQQTSGSTAITEGIISPSANYAEAEPVNQTLNSFASTPAYNLNGNLTAGPGNVSWAFEWSQAVGAGQELDIFKDKSLSVAMVPEPSTIALGSLGALGMGALALVRRRRSA